MSRMLKNIGLFCKIALQKRPIFCKETYIFKHPTNRCHPISNWPNVPRWGSDNFWGTAPRLKGAIKLTMFKVLFHDLRVPSSWQIATTSPGCARDIILMTLYSITDIIFTTLRLQHYIHNLILMTLYSIMDIIFTTFCLQHYIHNIISMTLY